MFGLYDTQSSNGAKLLARRVRCDDRLFLIHPQLFFSPVTSLEKLAYVVLPQTHWHFHSRIFECFPFSLGSITVK